MDTSIETGDFTLDNTATGLKATQGVVEGDLEERSDSSIQLESRMEA